ncbi:MAG: hypothetical protein GVY06_09110 [Alphaproteobacteria bacterium]|jgi:EAL domain-containing protein (putative c-di-GMP-specific phosphodiesterase class I)|nr:hypothetical protein [Alphaproteobacteria bacterium]
MRICTSTPVIDPLTHFIVQDAISDAAEWRSHGFYIARPMPGEAMTGWIEANTELLPKLAA